MHRTLPQVPRFKLSPRRPGHEETGEPLEGSSSEEEEESAEERGTEESPHTLDSMECLSIGEKTVEDGSSSGRFIGADAKRNEFYRRRFAYHTRNSVSKQDKTTQKALLSPLPSFFVGPIYRDVPQSPSYRVTKVGPVIEQTFQPPPRVLQKKKPNALGQDLIVVPKNRDWTPEGAPRIGLPARVLLPPPGKSKCRALEPSRTPHRRSQIGVNTEAEPRKEGVYPLDVMTEKNKTEADREVKEKLVYVVEEKGKNVTKVETDLFTLNEILTIKKDLLELSEFAKKLKKLKQTNKDLDSGRREDGTCHCDPTAHIFENVNKRIEALEARQEELEKIPGTKFGYMHEEEMEPGKGSEMKTLTIGSPNPSEAAKTNAIVRAPVFPKAEMFVSRAEAISNTEDLVNELLDIKAQLKRLEEKRPPKPSTEEVFHETTQTPPGRKDHPIAVFSSKTYILTPDNLAKKKEEGKAIEGSQYEEKVRVEEASLVRNISTDENDIRMLMKPNGVMVEEIPTEENGRKYALRKCSPPPETHSNQEPQKNRATENDQKVVDMLKTSEMRSLDICRSYTECFASPSGKFFAWMKKSREKLLKNLRAEKMRPKVPDRTSQNHPIPTTSTSTLSNPSEETHRMKPKQRHSERVLTRIAPVGGHGVRKREKTARNENVRSLKRRSLSKDKMNKEDKNEAVKRLPKCLESTTWSSLSELLETLDFEGTSKSAELWRQQQSTEFNEKRYARERRKMEAKSEEENTRRERKIINRERKTGHDKNRQERRLRRKSDEGSGRLRKKENRLNPYLEEKNLCYHKKKRPIRNHCSEESVKVLQKYDPEKLKSDSSTEKPSDERFTFKNILKSFNWLYSRFGSSSISPEYHEKKDKMMEKQEKGRNDDWEDCYDDCSAASLTDDEPVRNHINCDCVRVYLETEMLQKLTALTHLQKLSDGLTASETGASSNSNLVIKKSHHKADKHRRHHSKKNKTTKEEHKRRKNEVLCRKCKQPPNLGGKEEEPPPTLGGKALPSAKNPGSDERPQGKEIKVSPEHSPVISFLHHFYKNRQQKTTPGKVSPEAREECKDTKQQCCAQCGGKLKPEEFEQWTCGLDDIKDEYRRRKKSVSEDLICSTETCSTPDGEERQRNRKDTRHYGKYDRKKRKRQRKDSSDEEQERKDEATECHFLKDGLFNGLDKTTETDDWKPSFRMTSRERTKRIKDRLSSLLYLWKTLQRFTREKGCYGRSMAHKMKVKAVKKISRLDRFSLETLLEERCRRESGMKVERPCAIERKIKEMARGRRGRRKRDIRE